jgi:hypothetical protein
MLFDLAQTSKVSHKEVRTIIRKLRSSQNSAVCLEKDLSDYQKAGVRVLLCSFATPSRAALAVCPHFSSPSEAQEIGIIILS